MQDTLTSYNELAKRYGFAATPESVSRLTKLVASQDSDLEEIARVISKEPALKARILRIANPEAANESEYNIDDVEQALMRNGIGCALLLAMGTPLAVALTKTFQTMLSLKLESIEHSLAVPLSGSHFLGSIDFGGKATGRVYMRMSIEAARYVAATILGLKPEEMSDDTEIRDTVGELLNIMTGNFKSNLCDAGLDCRLKPPVVRISDDDTNPIIPGGGLERMAFRAGKFQLFVSVTVNPFSD